MVKVGIGQVEVLSGKGILTAFGLGSCIGLFLYEPHAKVGGLAHIMLPGLAPERSSASRTKYAENAVSAMLDAMADSGAKIRKIGGILVGGSHMFRETYGEGRVSIGQKNTDGVREILLREKISIVAEDIGGDHGRTVEAHVETGRVVVKSFRHGVKEFIWPK